MSLDGHLLIIQMKSIINTSDRYRLAALLEVAWVHPAALATAEIARRRDIPAAYLALLLRDLRRDGLIVSRRGPGGGFALARHPSEVRLGDLLTADLPAGDDQDVAGRLEGLLVAAREQVLDHLTLADLVAWDRELRPAPAYDI